MTLAVAVALTLLISCSGATEETQMASTIQDVKARHAHRLLTLPGVVSVGIGSNPDGQAVIVVGLDRRRPETQANLPAQLEGYPVRAEIVGVVRAQ
jgi:hypothetical protein